MSARLFDRLHTHPPPIYPIAGGRAGGRWIAYQTRKGAPILSDEKWADLVASQSTVRTRFHYTSDMSLYGTPEFWTVIQDSYRGDCEDFALTCRKLLMNKGGGLRVW